MLAPTQDSPEPKGWGRVSWVAVVFGGLALLFMALDFGQWPLGLW
jgi:hypothetical protein